MAVDGRFLGAFSATLRCQDPPCWPGFLRWVDLGKLNCKPPICRKLCRWMPRRSPYLPAHEAGVYERFLNVADPRECCHGPKSHRRGSPFALRKDAVSRAEVTKCKCGRCEDSRQRI